MRLAHQITATPHLTLPPPPPDFCQRYGLRLKAMREIRKLRVQLTNQINLVVPSASLGVDPRMAPPAESQCRLLRQVLLAGLPDHVARRVEPQEVNDPKERPRWKGAYRWDAPAMGGECLG